MAIKSQTRKFEKAPTNIGKTWLLSLCICISIFWSSSKTNSAPPTANVSVGRVSEKVNAKAANTHRHGAQDESEKPHTLAASFYSVRDNLKTTLTLNSEYSTA